MEGNQNIENIAPKEEKVSNEEAIDIARKIAFDNEVILQALTGITNRQQENRRYNILKVRSDIDNSKRQAFINATICGVSTLAFMSFAQVAAQKLGMPSVIESFQNAAVPNMNANAGLMKTTIEFLQDYVKNVFGPLNAKDFISELGPVGSMFGLLASFSGNGVLKNLKEWNAKNRELNIMKQTMPVDVANIEKEMPKFSFKLAWQSLRNQTSEMARDISNIFKKKNIEYSQISEPKAIGGFNKPSDPILQSSMSDWQSETEYDSDEVNNDSKLGRGR